MKVKLEKALITTGGEVKEVEFDFNKLKGSDLIAAEKEVRAMGDQTPSVFLSMNFQAIVAAKLIGVPVDDILDLPATDFRNIVFPVANFCSVRISEYTRNKRTCGKYGNAVLYTG